MKIVKEQLIYTKLNFDETEKQLLADTYNLISKVRVQNIHHGVEDTFLTDHCEQIIDSISILLDNYTNEYSDNT